MSNQFFILVDKNNEEKLRKFKLGKYNDDCNKILKKNSCNFVWGIHRAIKNQPHKHFHEHDEEDAHSHVHDHSGEHAHVHEVKSKANITPWVLFTIFIFGPCEPLIPLLMYPAAKGSISAVIMVTSAFAITTLVTMLTLTMVLSYGLIKLPLFRLERYSHALAGLTIFICGGAIKFLGL